MRTRIIPIVGLAAGALLVSAGAASASPRPVPHVTHAVTVLTDRPDGGNGSPDPYWADDSMIRDLTITRTGGTAGAWTFTAKLTDTGTFTTIKGTQAPNQGGSYAGDLIKAKVTGLMSGFADFSFTASTLPDAAFNAGMPVRENDHGAVTSDSTSTWYELAFPAGTVFGGAGIGNWSWSYQVNVPQHSRPYVIRQHWTDSLSNGYGDLPGDGQITG